VFRLFLPVLMVGSSSKALLMVKEELGSAQRMVETANKQLKESQIEIDKLVAENAKLKAGLAMPTTPMYRNLRSASRVSEEVQQAK
jgi:hypothetical protein